ncbi:MAG: (Fe-S)-binding protein [Planctomycetales bacterium]|nr:(Fe-S)-binding protein [Planctomycetales bacterium]
MRIGLFIPCYIDQFYPRVGVATLRLLERFSDRVTRSEGEAVNLVFPREQTCCGQPMANAGCVDDAAPVAERFMAAFGDCDYVVGPSGSCVAMVRKHYHGLVKDEDALHSVQEKTFELCEFLVDVAGVESIGGRFVGKVGLHEGCHGTRELELARGSERMLPAFSKIRSLLTGIEGLELTGLDRTDECCGFGGTFAVFEEAVSCMMGRDRVADHERHGAEVLASADMSCLMHLGGLIRREQKPLRVMHVAEVFCEALEIPLDV